MRRYEDTIQTEFDWIGDIPSEWSVPRLKHLTACLDGKRIPLNGEERSKMQGDIPYWGANAIMDYVSDCLFDEPLLLVGEDGAPFTIKGRDVAFESHGKVWPNNHIHVLRPNDNSLLRFLTYSMNATDYANFVEGSTRQKLTQSALMNIPITLPPKREATQVVKFLDYETAKIDALIDEQKRLIELLKEKRQAVISHAVTKGLNPDVPMKDSGVEWFGEVPEHWELVKLGKLKTVLTDYTANGSFADLKANVKYLDSPSYARLIRLTDLRKDLAEDDSVWVNKDAYDYLKKSALFGGEFLLANVGANAGLFYQMPNDRGPATLAPNMFMAKFKQKKVQPAYIAFAAQSDFVHQQFRVRATASSAQPKLNKDDFKSVSITLPPKSEQAEIVDYIKQHHDKIDDLLIEACSAVKLLQERRSALISAAVTGKIDVRDWQPPAGSDTVDSNAPVQTERHYG